MTAQLFDVTNLSKKFGGLQAVDDVSISVAPNSIISVIGPNGAGKTTFFNLVTGIYPSDSGSIMLDGISLGGLRPDEVAQAGLARTFQNIRLFPSMTALENVVVGTALRVKAGYWDALLRTSKYEVEEQASIGRASELLRFVGLIEKANTLAGGCSRVLETVRER